MLGFIITINANCILCVKFLQNDISDVLDLTFSMDADEEKLILCERTEVRLL